MHRRSTSMARAPRRARRSTELVIAPEATQRTTIWGTYFDELLRPADGERRFRQRRFRFAGADGGGNAGQSIAQPPLSQR